MSTSPQGPIEQVTQPTPGTGGFRWLVAIVVILGLALGYLAYAEYQMRTELTAQLEQVNSKLGSLDVRAATLEDKYAELEAQAVATAENLGVTKEQLAKVRGASWRARKEQRKAAEQFQTELEQQHSQLGSLTADVTDVRGNVEETRQTLEGTMATLGQAMGDLGVQSGLIARNREELEKLKRWGVRDYFEFDMKKSKQYTRVGMISIRLNKTDTKRQKYTMTVQAEDKRIEKKDKTLLEPVQFYLQGTQHLLEIVVYRIEKNRVEGYLSVPKEVVARR